MARTRKVLQEHLRDGESLSKSDLSVDIIRAGIDYAYGILDTIDNKLVEAKSERLSQLIELANLSSVIGNLVGAGMAAASSGKYRRNGPHKYPDLLHTSGDDDRGVELKVALEKNKPKGHLPKAGYYVTIRYVLGDADGKVTSGKGNRGDVVWVWEAKFGWLSESDFAFSSTAGDSGKTAVITTDAFNGMDRILADPQFCPYPIGSKYYPTTLFE